LQGTAVRMQLLRQQGRRAEVLGDAGQGREPAVAEDDEGAHRQRADRRLGGARILRAAAGVAQAAERRPGLWLAGSGATGADRRTGAGSRLSRARRRRREEQLAAIAAHARTAAAKTGVVAS